MSEFDENTEQEGADRDLPRLKSSQELTNLYYNSFDISMGEQDIQSKFFLWSATGGAFDKLSSEDITSIPDIKAPSEHKKISEETSDQIRMKGGIISAYTMKDSDADRKELANEIISKILDKDATDTMIGREGREYNPNFSKADYDTRKDPHGSVVRRIFIKGQRNALIGNNSVIDHFGRNEMLPVLNRVKELVDNGEEPNAGLETEMYEKTWILANHWAREHEGMTMEDFFDPDK